MSSTESLPLAHPVNAPEEFDLGIGGYHGPVFRLRVIDGELVYHASCGPFSFSPRQDLAELVEFAAASGDKEHKATALSIIEQSLDPVDRWIHYRKLGLEPGREPFPPITPNWPELSAELNAIGVWDWKEHYVDPSIIDGTGWSLRIRWGAKYVESSGSNAYPTDSAGTATPYKRLLASLRRQIGGRALH